jgi:hypothetical protein
MKIVPLKSKVITCKGPVPIINKIAMDYTILELVNAFTYFGFKISYEEEKDITSKRSKLLQILVILKNVLKPNLP